MNIKYRTNSYARITGCFPADELTDVGTEHILRLTRARNSNPYIHRPCWEYVFAFCLAWRWVGKYHDKIVDGAEVAAAEVGLTEHQHFGH